MALKQETLDVPNKAAERATPPFQLGKLLAPLYCLAEASPPPSAAEYHITAARCLPDCERWNQEVNRFTTFENYQLRDLANDIAREPTT
jgi:hypothetical protein